MDQTQSLAAMQLHVRDLERELSEAKRVANRMSIRAGQGALYPDAEQPSEATLAALRSDQFYGQGLSTAMREYLAMRRATNLGPATVTEIHAALSAGGFAFETKDPDNAKRNIRISLTKNTAIFHRLPDGAHYGLADWYPEARKRERDENDAEEPSDEPRRKSGKPKRKRLTGAGVAHLDESLGSLPRSRLKEEGPTLLGAVRRGLEAVEAEFTKQDIVDWIDQHYPQLKAEERKQSVFSMISRFKDDLRLETARRGKGTEPHVFRKGAQASNGQHH